MAIANWTSQKRLKKPSKLWNCLLAINLGDIVDKIQATTGVTPLVVIPGNQLDEGISQSNTGFDIEDAGGIVTHKIGGDNLILGNGQDSLEVTGGGGLEGLDDFGILGRLLKVDSEINDGNIRSWDTESHAGQLAV